MAPGKDDRTLQIFAKPRALQIFVSRSLLRGPLHLNFCVKYSLVQPQTYRPQFTNFLAKRAFYSKKAFAWNVSIQISAAGFVCSVGKLVDESANHTEEGNN